MPRSFTNRPTAIKVGEQIVHFTGIENHNSLFLLSLGGLHVHWGNCESVLLIYAMLLSGTKRKTLDVYWHSLTNTSARIDFVWSLAKEHIKKKKVREDLRQILADFRGNTKIRNLYAHGQYIYDDDGKMSAFSGCKLTPDSDKPLKRTRKVCNKRMLDHIKNTVTLLEKLNLRMWDFAFILEKETGMKLEALPQRLLEQRKKTSARLRQKKGK